METQMNTIRNVFPQWDSDMEIVLALRENNYDVQETIHWKIEEDKYSTGSSSKGKKRRQSTAAVEHKVRDLEGLIAELQQALHDKDAENLKLKTQIKAMQSGLTRQNTMLDSRVTTLQKDLEQAEEEIQRLEHLVESHEESLTSAILESSDHAELSRQLAAALDVS